MKNYGMLTWKEKENYYIQVFDGNGIGEKKELPNMKYARYFHSSFDEYWERKRKISKRFFGKNYNAKSNKCF